MYGSLDAIADIVCFNQQPEYGEREKKDMHIFAYMCRKAYTVHGHSNTHPRIQQLPYIKTRLIDCRMSDSHLAVNKHNKHHNNRT